MSPEAGVKQLIEKRYVVTPKILEYPVVRQLHGLLAAAAAAGGAGGTGGKVDPNEDTGTGTEGSGKDEL